MIMNKDERENLKTALKSSLDAKEWELKRQGNAWRLVSKTDQRTFELPVHELDEQLQGLEDREEKQQHIEAFVARVLQALPATTYSTNLREQRGRLYPVIRSASFNIGETPGKRLIKKEHTAETAVLYALDFGNSYALINEQMARDADVSVEDVHQWAIQNVKKLPNEPKMDFVADNRFYFFSQDEYAASRILNDRLLADMKRRVKGEMAIAIPHQDVLIVADLHDAAGYNVLGQMTLKFYGEGHNPITPLPMVVEDNGELTPILVMPDSIKQKQKFKR